MHSDRICRSRPMLLSPDTWPPRPQTPSPTRCRYWSCPRSGPATRCSRWPSGPRYAAQTRDPDQYGLRYLQLDHFHGIQKGHADQRPDQRPDREQARLLALAPHQRITFSRRSLLNCRSLILHCYGAGKKEILDQALTLDTYRPYPIQGFLHQSDTPIKIYWTE